MRNIKINRPKVETKYYLYSYQLTSEILGIKISGIEFVMLLDNGYVLVGLYNSAKYISSVEYITRFVNERKQRATNQDLTVDPHSYNSTLIVRNKEKKTSYQVNLQKDYLSCTCKDYEISSGVFGTNQVCCKHGYKVLRVLGCESLSDYVKWQKNKLRNKG